MASGWEGRGSGPLGWAGLGWAVEVEVPGADGSGLVTRGWLLAAGGVCKWCGLECSGLVWVGLVWIRWFVLDGRADKLNWESMGSGGMEWNVMGCGGMD